MKRFFRYFSFCAALLLPLHIAAGALTEPGLGDVNQDGSATRGDAELLLAGLLGRESLSDDAMQCADLSRDGILNAADLSLLKQRLLSQAQTDDPRLIWSDEFDGDSPDPARWSYELGNWKLDAAGNYITNGWGNNEQQFYTDSNASVSDGILTIAARQENYTDPVQGEYAYTSARLSSQHLFSVCGGRIEVRARCDAGKSLWPAIWMLPEDSLYGGWAASGEIDIMEGWGSTPQKICGTVHFGDVWPNNTYLTKDYFFAEGDSSEQWHTYAIEWRSGEIRWYVDDVLYSTQTEWFSANHAYPAPFDQNFYLILNLAVGGTFDGIDGVHADPATFANGEKHFDIDYVRVYDLGDSFTAAPISSLPLESYSEAADASLTNKDGETVIDIRSTGSLAYGVMGLLRGNPVRAGEQHTLSFDAASSVPRNITVTAEDAEYTRYLDETITLGSAPEHFSFAVTAPADMKLDLKFLLGDIDGAAALGSHSVTISNIAWN